MNQVYSLSEHVADTLAYFNSRERKLKIEDKAKLVAGRITKGWAFLGKQTSEQHNKQVEEIKQEVYRQLGNS